jgi:hypothetical protein
MSLFQKATPEAERLKVYVYGKSGTGKTIMSLNFPNPVVIDAEDGTTHYGNSANFYRIKTYDPIVIKEAVDELLENPVVDPTTNFIAKTFVIDPFTVVYDAILAAHTTRMKSKTLNPQYELQPKDYKYIKQEVKSLVLKILSLDMNVMVTARSAPEYSKEKMMEVIGTKAEGPDQLPYLFDVVLELFINEEGKRMARVKKDRTNSLPAEFEYSYDVFVKHIGIENLNRDPIVIKQKQALDKRKGRNVTIYLNNSPVQTAGVTAEQLEQLKLQSGRLGAEKVMETLQFSFSVDSLLDLKEDEAALFITELEGLN